MRAIGLLSTGDVVAGGGTPEVVAGGGTPEVVAGEEPGDGSMVFMSLWYIDIFGRLFGIGIVHSKNMKKCVKKRTALIIYRILHQTMSITVCESPTRSDITDAIRNVEHRLYSGIAQANTNRQTPTAIFDLDGTLVENGSNKPIHIIIDLFNKLTRHGVKCFVATARTSDAYAVSEILVGNLGIQHTKLMCIPLDYKGWPSSSDKTPREYIIPIFKKAVRWGVATCEGPLVFVVGDSEWDVKCPSRDAPPSVGFEDGHLSYGELKDEPALCFLKLPANILQIQ